MSASKRTSDQMRISWDFGTAYDFFLSYAVLRDPKKFGVRSSWASGMRARLQSDARGVLDTFLLVVGIPAKWVLSLPQPKDVDHCLGALSQIPANDRLPELTCLPADEGKRSAKQQLLSLVAHKGSWCEDDLEALRTMQSSKKNSRPSASDLEALRQILDTWSQAEAFGEKLLPALRSFHSVFFREEEQRIAPKLAQSLEYAKQRAQVISTVDFLEEISQGILYEGLPHIEELILTPSYWVSPFIQNHHVDPNRRLWVFGARPADDSLVPGELVPDALRVSLKALADPTRLRILRYLGQQPMTKAELTKKLRLRMPTVIHHLSALRLAGLVLIHVEMQGKGHRQRYGVRTEGLDATLSALKGFIGTDQEPAQPPKH